MNFDCALPRSESRYRFASPPGVSVTTRTVIIESNRAKAELLAYFLNTASGLPVLAVEMSGVRGIATVTEMKPELVVATLTPTGFIPRDFVRELRRAAPSAKLVFLATEINDCLLHTLASAEYHGLVYEPDENLEAIRHAIVSAQNGRRFVSARFLQGQRNLRSEPNAFPKILSPREQEVLSCITRSLSDDEIATQLGCSPGTVLSHRRKLMYKLGIHSTPKLIRYGADKGFASNPPFQPTPEILPTEKAPV